MNSMLHEMAVRQRRILRQKMAEALRAGQKTRYAQLEKEFKKLADTVIRLQTAA